MDTTTISPPDLHHPLAVCLITGEYPPAIGGIADYTASLGHALQSAGMRVSVCTTLQHDARRALDGDIRIVEIPDWRVPSLGRVAEAVASTTPDIVHLQYQAAAFGMSPALVALPYALRMRTQARFVITFHDLRPPYLFPKAGPLRRWFNHALIGASGAVLFTNSADLARAHPRRPAYWIPIGSSLMPTTPIDGAAARHQLGIDEEEAVVASFGFTNFSKGIDTLLLAAERLIRGRVPLRLLLIGDEAGSSDPRNRETATAMRALAQQLGVDEFVIRTGLLSPSDVSVALAAANIAALPYADGASLRRSSLLTCLAHGVPVVTTMPVAMPVVPPANRIPPFDQPSQTQLDDCVIETVPPEDDAALARAIYRLLDDPERRDELAAAGPAFMRKLAWPDIAQATMAVYRA